MREDPSVAALRQDDMVLLRVIAAEPRPTGSKAIAAARDRCARELRDMGFDVREQAFEYSAFPGRFATPLLGAAGAVIVGVAGARGAAGERTMPLLVAAAGAVLLFMASSWLVKRGVLDAPVLRQRGVNLEAVRSGQRPIVWLSAHLDTKSQPVPTLLRSAGIVLECIGYALMLALASITAAGSQMHRSYWVIAALVTLVGAIPVMFSIVTRRSPGALDNASGVATVMAAARHLRDLAAVGVLITDAEELGLAGARAWSKQQIRGAVLNCDGVDDAGGIVVMYSGKRPESLLRAVDRAASALGVPYAQTRMIPGVLTDSVAFTDWGMTSVTFSRGTWRSLARVHTRRDDLAHLNGTGIAETGALIASTAREMGEER